MNRKKLALLAIVISLVGASCGGTPTTPNPQQTKKGSKNLPKTNYTLQVWSELDDKKAFEFTGSIYQSLRTNVMFEYKHINPDNYEQDLISALATGKGPDIVLLQNDQLARFQDKLLAVPDDFYGTTKPVAKITADYPPAAVTNTVIGNKVYGIPLYMDTLSLFINKTLLSQTYNERLTAKQKDPYQKLLIRAPADWDEFKEEARLLTKRDGNKITIAGAAIGISTNTSNTADLFAVMNLQRGSQMVSVDQTEATFHLADSQNPNVYPGTAVLDYIKQFTDPKSAYYSWDATQSEALEGFIEGKVAMMFNYSSVIPYIQQRSPKLGYSRAPLPQIPNTETIVDFGKYHAMSVTNNTKYPDLAWDFIDYYLGSQPGRYAQSMKLSGPTKSGQLASTTVTQRIFNTTPQTMQIPTAQTWYKGKNPTEVDETVSIGIDQVIVGGKAPRDILNQAAQQVTALLGG